MSTPESRNRQVSAIATPGTTIAVSALVARHSLFPRWAFYASGVVLAAGAVVLAAVHPDLAAWKHDGGSAWMTPWYPFIVGIVSPPRGARGACGANDRRSGWVLLGASILLATLTPVISLW